MTVFQIDQSPHLESWPPPYANVSRTVLADAAGREGASMGELVDQGSAAPAPAAAGSARSGFLGLDRFTLGIALGAVALVALLCAVILTRPNDSQPLDEAQPAGVVHNFYLARLRNDPRTAYGYLSAEAQIKQPYERFAAMSPNQRSERRLRIDDERVEGETARVTVRWTTASGGFFPFSSNEYTNTQTIVLRREGEAWKLTQPIYGY